MSSTAHEAITQWLRNNPLVFRSRIDGTSFTLIEFGTGKELKIDAKNIAQFRLTPNPQGQKDYLNLVFQDGREIVLCHAGIAFTPSFVSTGPLPDAPPVSCMTDYLNLRTQLTEILKTPERKMEALLLFQILISILDGAKLVGLDVGVEEAELDAALTAFEKKNGGT